MTINSMAKKVVSVFAVAPIRIGGSEAFAREMSRQLGEKSWQSVLCYCSAPQGAVRSFLELPNVLFETLEDPSVPSLGNLQRLALILARHRPQILHLHFTPYVSPYPWVAKLLGVSHVFLTDHASHPAGWVASRHPAWKRVLTRMINSPLTKALGVSKFKRDCLTKKGGFPANRIAFVYNGVDLCRAAEGARRAEAFRNKYAIGHDRIVVLQVGWMIPEKGFAVLLHAARLAIARNPRIQLVMVGEGPCRQEYVKLAETLGIRDHVCFTGLVHDPLAGGAYAAADIVCQLSQWEEAFGNSIAEAMAAGKPLIASRVGAIPELVSDGISGLLVDRGDITTVAEQILTLATDRARRVIMGQRGKASCEKRFDIRRCVAQLLQHYDLSHVRPADFPAGRTNRECTMAEPK